jgi:hypothetical protein
MDPDANLREQREIVQAIHAIVDAVNDDGSYKPGQADELAEHATRLADLVGALDGWIRRGGCLPALWQAQQTGRTA